MSDDKSIVLLGEKGLQLTNFSELYRFSEFVIKAGFAPKGFESVEKVFLAIQMGKELDISPMMALQNMAVVNGRPGIFGDLCLAKVQGHPEFEDMKVDESQDGCTVTIKRRGRSAVSGTFTMTQANGAGLTSRGGDSPWKKYPDQMLFWRAFHLAAKRTFSDALKGFKSVQELEDEPAMGWESAKPAKVLPITKPEFKNESKDRKPARAPEIQEPSAKAEDKKDVRQVVPTEAIREGHEEKPQEADRRLSVVDKVLSQCKRDLVQEDEVVEALFHQDVDVGKSVGNVADLPDEALESALKHWPTLLFTIDTIRKKSKK